MGIDYMSYQIFILFHAILINNDITAYNQHCRLELLIDKNYSSIPRLRI